MSNVAIHFQMRTTDASRVDRARKRFLKSNGNNFSRAEYVRQAVLAALDRDEQSGPQAAACGGNAGPGPAASKRK